MAAPPGNWSLAVERVFGITRVTTEVDDGDSSSSSSTTSISLFSAFSGQRGYSSPRFALDYIANSGLSFGGAIAYESISGDGQADRNVWVVAPRLGYFARPGAGFGIWPRAGLTHVSVSTTGDDETSTATAITLEVPLVFLLGSTLALTVLPHADIGIAGHTGDVDRTVTEFGLQFGANAFF